jgi:hypothetical protein
MPEKPSPSFEMETQLVAPPSWAGSHWLEFHPVPSRQKVAGQALFFGSWLAVTGIGMALKPAAEGHGTHQQLGFPPCPSVLLFNRPCPGCGLTTSFTRLLHGDLTGAFDAHPLGPLMYLLYTTVAFIALFAFWKSQKLNVHTWRFQAVMVGFVTILLGYGVIRFATTPNYQTAREQSIASMIRAVH